MISALVFNVEEFLESYKKGILTKSILVDLEDNESLLSESLANYAGSFTNMCLGLCVGDSSKAIDIYKKYSSLLPIKTNDIVLLVRVDSEDCIYFNLEKLNNFLYFNKGVYSDIMEYVKGNGLYYSLFSDIKFEDVESAFLVTDDWDFKAVDSSEPSLEVLVEKVNSLGTSSVWGN